MTRSNYSHEVRVLACAGCGAPLDVALDGGDVRCRDCGSLTPCGRRDESADRATASRGPRLDEAVRFERLREQDGRPLLPPPGLTQYVVGGELASQLVPEAMSEWRQLRTQLAAAPDFPSEERLYFLTMMLYGQAAPALEERRVRGMLETAVEVCSSARHRQVLRGMLSRNAARKGDLEAADDWLASCDPFSDDLHADSAYRCSRACVATVRGDYATVLRQLGSRVEDVPIADHHDVAAALLRANAHERMGQGPTAVAQLVAAMQRLPGGASTFQSAMRTNAELGLCPESFPQALKKMGTVDGGEARGGGAWPARLLHILLPTFVSVGFFVAAALTAPESKTDDGYPLDTFFVFMGACFAIAPIILTAVARFRDRARTRMLEKGVDGRGQILRVSPTNLLVNDQPVVSITLRVFVGTSAPYEVTVQEAVPYTDLMVLQPGVTLELKVDPDKPSKVMIVRK